MDPRWIVILLIFLAFAFPTGAAVRAYRRTRKSIASIDARLQRIDQTLKAKRAAEEAAKTPQDAAAVGAPYIAQLKADGYPMGTYGHSAAPTALSTSARLVRDALKADAWDVVIAGFGLLCGLIASVWSLYLPPM